MKPEEFAISLQRSFAGFGKKIIYDMTARGEDFCEIVYANPDLPSFPLTVTIYEDGALLSFGNAEDITGGVRLSLDETVQAVDDVISDKMIFSLRYENAQRREDEKLSGVDIFLVSGEAGDMSAEYEKYISTLKKKLGWFARLFTSRKGVFRILSFTGKTDLEISR